MAKAKQTSARWIENLRDHMEKQGLNPRSLSLKAGLNPTAVRDMLEGRTRFPRYDTAEALAEALGITPYVLMNGAPSPDQTAILPDEDLDILTEIIARLHEVADERRHQLGARDFAAMVTTIYRQMQGSKSRKAALNGLKPKIADLIDYEARRKRSQKA